MKTKKHLLLIGSILFLLQTNLLSQYILLVEDFENYTVGPLADETESPWVQLEIGRNANVSEYWVHSGNKNFQINSFTTSIEIDYVKFNLDQKPAQLNLVLWYTPDGYYIYKDFAEIGLSNVTSKFESEAIAGFWGSDHKVFFNATGIEDAIEVFNELEYGKGPADFGMGTPKHNYIRAEFDFNNSEVRFYIDTDPDAPLRNTIEFDGTLDFNAVYIAGGLNPTYIDDIHIESEGVYNQSTIIKRFTKKANYLVYPNPFKDYINIKYNSSLSSMISIYTINGELLIQENIQKDLITIDMSNFLKGLYIMQLIVEDNIWIEKIIKK